MMAPAIPVIAPTMPVMMATYSIHSASGALAGGAVATSEGAAADPFSGGDGDRSGDAMTVGGSGDAMTVGVATVDTDADGPVVAYRPSASAIDAAGVSRAISAATAAALCSEKSRAAARGSKLTGCRGESGSAVFSVVRKMSLKDGPALVDMLAIQSFP
jgi:hypothetical protein